MGPVRSVGVSAVTQVSESSSVWAVGDVVVRVVVVDGGGMSLESWRKRAAALRFLEEEDFLSPLKLRGLRGIFGFVVIRILSQEVEVISRAERACFTTFGKEGIV